MEVFEIEYHVGDTAQRWTCKLQEVTVGDLKKAKKSFKSWDLYELSLRDWCSNGEPVEFESVPAAVMLKAVDAYDGYFRFAGK